MSLVNQQPVILLDGSAASPSLQFASHPLTGMYLASDLIGFSSGGTSVFTMGSAGNAILGTNTNNDAAAGFVGEVLQASRLKSAATGASSTVSLNVLATALSLTAGDWDVSGCLVFLPAASTSITLLKAAISKTSATLPATDTIGVPTSGEVSAQYTTAANVATGDISLVMPTCRISLATTTSIYLVANATFSASTLTVYGSLNARRAR